MGEVSGALHLAALLLYGVAAGLLAVSLARSDRRLPRFATALAALAVAVHGGALAGYWARWGELPLVGLGPSLSTLAFLVGVGSVGVALLRNGSPLGLVLVPVAALLVGVAQLVGVSPSGEPSAFRGAWFALHVLLALVGYAGLTVAFAAGLMYLLQFRELKGKRFGPVFRFFPPLETLERVGERALLVGFPSLSLALLLAWAWLASFSDPPAPGNPHVLWGVLSWFVLLAMLTAHRGGGQRGHRAALASVVGFTVVVVSYLLLRLQSGDGGAFL